MTVQYGALTYKGDVTRGIVEGSILGHDETYRPYQVTEAVYDPETDKTTVHIEHASEEALKNYLREENRQTEIVQALYRAGLTGTTEAARLAVLAQTN